MSQTMQTRWFIRTAIKNYWAFGDTENAHTFIATPVDLNNGAYAAPMVVTFECPYIVEQNRRDIQVDATRLVERAGSVLVMHSRPNGKNIEVHVVE